jgi:SAM-dependent methyltransferase
VAAVSSPQFWEERYARGEDGWDLHVPTRGLVDFVTTTPPPRGRVIVPGCGRGHDARFLATHGHDVTGVDFSPAALRDARALARRDDVTVRYEERDIFSLGQDHASAFDGAWEYTCYCAIDPARRTEYLRMLAAVVRPGGWLLACFFPIRDGGGGPPFPVTIEEVRRGLPPAFQIEREFAPQPSAPSRRGQEWMVWARRGTVTSAET